MGRVWEDGPPNPAWPIECDLRYQYPHGAWDPKAGTLYGKRAEFEDFDVATAIEDGGVRKTILQIVRNIESHDKVDGFKQVGDRILVCPKNDANAGSLGVCWECKWLTKAHRPGCAWKLVRDVNAL